MFEDVGLFHLLDAMVALVHMYIKPFADRWTKPDAVENYLLDMEEALNPGSRPTRVTPADRARKHKVSAEHDTLGQEREAKRPNRSEA
ncbi:predicted protein [Plenodomus lingam JN3]|uniref:Predicted protein n=1 Tax=Leptosphaeria maculans (strain JN3 / isolate v23.1.3 / race Av1-4-5-6-7-8) TaxID=985895 RepID=E5ABC1_LEPMJ|nr:predicted protein [Plenodomus lingam JN3]CBY00962.1 predicted protein [Plenodomus lingam JN3]